MLLKSPKNTEKVYWTGHSKYKMQYYGLSAQKILGVIRRPKRKEEGIVKNTIAVMQPISPKIIKNKEVWKQEVWAMYQKKIKNQKSKCKSIEKFNNNQIKIISAWRYPGVSPKKNPIPEEIISEILELK
jgi:hypothetical protein